MALCSSRLIENFFLSHLTTAIELYTIPLDFYSPTSGGYHDQAVVSLHKAPDYRLTEAYDESQFSTLGGNIRVLILIFELRDDA